MTASDADRPIDASLYEEFLRRFMRDPFDSRVRRLDTSPGFVDKKRTKQ